MGYETSVAIRNNVAITATGWTDIGGSGVGSYQLPMACDSIVIINTSGVSILLATDPGNSASAVTLAAGSSWQLGLNSRGPTHGWPTTGCRFQPSLPACSLKSSSGPQTITLEFTL
jgi:hypothetical protein